MVESSSDLKVLKRICQQVEGIAKEIKSLYPKERKLLGQYLLEENLVTEYQLNKALGMQRTEKTIGRIGTILVNLGYLPEENIAEALEKQLGIPYVDLNTYEIKIDVLNIVTAFMAKDYRIIPLEKTDGGLTLAMADPLNVFVIDKIEKSTGCHVRPVICTESGLDNALFKYYNIGEERR